MPDHHRAGASEQAPNAMSSGADWRDQAACRHADPDLFFPVGTTGPVLRQVDEAKRICQACPARTPCLAWALNHNVTSGVWGATTEEERHAIRRALIRPRNRA
jgi:WhiB family redox-sensing transcriptional regulator